MHARLHSNRAPFGVVFAIASLSLLVPLASAAAAESIDLVTGQQKLLSARGVTRIAIANPNVADVKSIEPDQVLVTAVGPGQTDLKIWQGSRILEYVVNVSSMDPQQLRREVERQLGDRDSIRVRVGRDNSVTLEGNVLTLSDLEKAEEVARTYPQIKNLVRLDPTAHSHIAEAINKQLERAGLMGARATVVGNTIFLEGIVDTEADLKKAEILTRAIGDNVQTMLTIGSSRMVELDVEFVEVSKNSLDRIGVQWPTDIAGAMKLAFDQTRVLKGMQPDSKSWTANATASSSIGLALQFEDGVTRTIARPRLVTASAREAKFLAGGEIPIPLITANSAEVIFKEYGIRLQITPTVDGSGTIQAKILSEVSSIDESVTVGGVPGFRTRKVETDVTLRDGETIVLSGLLALTESKDVSKVPILGHLPILGELFKSRRFHDAKTELVVFVTPRLVDPISKHLRDLSSEMLRKYDDAAGDVKFDLFD